MSQRGPVDAVSRLADAGRGPAANHGSDSVSSADPQHELLVGAADDPARPLRLARADHRRQLAAAGRDDSRAGRRPRPLVFDLRSAEHPPDLHRERPARTEAKTTRGCNTRSNGASSRACQWGEFDTALYELERAGAARRSSPRRSAADSARRPTGRSARWTTSMRPWRTTSTTFPTT